MVLLLSGCSETDDAAAAEGVPVSGELLVSGGRADLKTDSRLIFINYWAVWCAPCIAEMPELAHFSETHSSRAVVYAVNFDNPSLEQLRADIEALGVEVLALVEDPAAKLGLPRPEVMPTTFILRQGQLLDTLIGPQTYDDMVNLLEHWEAIL